MRRLALFAVLVFIAPALSDSANENALLAAAHTDYLNNPKMETRALAGAKGLARRDGDALTLTLKDRPPLTLKDASAACSNDDASTCVTYRLVAALPSRNSYVVAKGFYEGCGAVLLIDQHSGRQAVLADVPLFSPNSQRLLVQNECEAEDSESYNQLEIWRREGSAWRLEWAYTDKEAYAADPGLSGIFHSRVKSWVDDTIALDFWANQDGPEERRWAGTLHRGPSGWRLDAGRLRSP